MVVERDEIIKFARVNRNIELEDVLQIYRDIFPYDKICRIPFDNVILPLNPAKIQAFRYDIS